MVVRKVADKRQVSLCKLLEDVTDALEGAGKCELTRKPASTILASNLSVHAIA